MKRFKVTYFSEVDEASIYFDSFDLARKHIEENGVWMKHDCNFYFAIIEANCSVVYHTNLYI